MAKTLAEEVFGGVSDCKGMGTTIRDNRGKIPQEAVTRIPRYHEAEQVDPATVEIDNTPVTEENLCTHF